MCAAIGVIINDDDDDDKCKSTTRPRKNTRG